MKKIIIPALSLGFATILFSCDTRTYEDISPAKPDLPTYEANIKPIMTANCTSCHSNGYQDPDLTNYADVKANINNIILRMKDTSDPMPPNGNLPAGTISIIENWKATGMLEK